MCLAIPAIIKSIDGMEAEAEIGGISRHISIQLTPEVRVGDYVLVHTGYSISIVEQKDAEDTLEILREMASLAEESG